MRLLPHLDNMQIHSRELTVAPRRRGVTASFLLKQTKNYAATRHGPSTIGTWATSNGNGLRMSDRVWQLLVFTE